MKILIKKNLLLLIMFFCVEVFVKAESMPVQSFRGKRVPLNNFPSNVQIEEVSKSQNSSGFQIDVKFSNPVDAHSVFAKNIYVNEIPLSENTELIFSRDMKSLRFYVKLLNQNDLKIRIEGVKSVDGKSLETLKNY